LIHFTLSFKATFQIYTRGQKEASTTIQKNICLIPEMIFKNFISATKPDLNKGRASSLRNQNCKI